MVEDAGGLGGVHVVENVGEGSGGCVEEARDRVDCSTESDDEIINVAVIVESEENGACLRKTLDDLSVCSWLLPSVCSNTADD